MRFSQSTHLLMCLSLETLINVYHKDWLTYSGGTDRPGELCYNFSQISNELTQNINFRTRITDCDSHSPALIYLFLLMLASICSTMVFSPSRYSDHDLVSVSIDFPSNSERDAPFHPITYPITIPRLFSCWLRRSLWSFERCSMERYL